MIYVLGGGVGTQYACIGVTYPSGSTCTCTNGTKTLKAKGTSGTAIFNVPSTGTWTVTATNGSKTASKSVSITAEGQFTTLFLSYALYDNGEQGVSWEVYSKQQNATVTFASSAIQVRYSSTGMTGSVVNTAEAVDLTDAKTLTATITKNNANGYYFGASKSKYTYSSIDSPSSVFSAYAAAGLNTTGTITLTVDVSNLTGSYYVSFCGYTNNVDITYVNVV